ncbi:transcriptional regulator [Pyrobaculum aerophilum]|uniref:Transcriptional regulator n=1 Tax=Pyrobaculum aerophilum TaxID=13773 RepID=A0A371R397_9CREN|nr:transcriptional regulator [Pyrobaculum aerophilum]MCX8137553.1 transcriptional regulator [Pyrobaculum aerophilum]RFA95128.1 transcriptional regulator [Pyrobaculum aerophilum]RFA98243.1 transcriptional regulator [Pyrobaculum aerophilum]
MAKVEIKEVQEVRGFSVVKRVPNRAALTGDLKPNVILVFHGKEGNDMVVEIFTPDPNGDKTLPSATVAATKFSGSAEKVDNAYATLLFWALKEGKSLGTPSREIYTKVDRSQDPPEVEVEVQSPIQ